MEVGTLKFPWKIKDFSKLQTQKLYSDVFSLGTHKWRILAYPKGEDGENADHLSVYLEVAESETLSFGWSQNAKFSITLINQIDNKLSLVGKSRSQLKFDEKKPYWGFPSFISHKELHDPKKCYLVQDTCIFEADVTIYGEDPYSVGGATKDATKKEDNPLDNSIKQEDMDAFFQDLQSMVSVVSSEEEAKEALEVIEEAVNKAAPADLINNPGRMSQLTNAFDVLSSLDDCSVLTSDQKAALLSMQQTFISLPERAAKAVEDIQLFNHQELVKTTLDRKLGRCLMEFEKGKAETTQNEQNIAVLHERVDSLMAQISETKKKRDSSLLKQKEMFKLSKELKAKLDVLKLMKNFHESEAEKKESG